MKKLLSLALILVLCLTFTACKKNQENTDPNTAVPNNVAEENAECTELDIRMLMEQNLDCYFLFYVAPLGTAGEKDQNGYSKADEAYLKNYDELYNKVYDTYTEKTAQSILESPSAKTPLYKNIDGAIYVNADVIEPVLYEVAWEEFDVEITKSNLKKCSFTLSTKDFDNNDYTAQGTAVYENDKWVLTDVVA